MADAGPPTLNAPVRWGFVGPGRIAASLAAELVGVVQGGVLQAVASRSTQRAEAFAERFGAAQAYGSYQALLGDPDVDVVYIATPHPQHHAVALAAIAAGKHILVEKAFTATFAGAQQVAEAAAARGVFAMEAMWTRFQPAIVRLRETIAAGEIGEVRSVRADLGLAKPFDPADRLWDPAQGGGAMLDLAVYPVSFGQMVLTGRAATVQVTGALAGNGVDAESSILAGYGDRHAIASASLLTRLPGGAAVFGTTGWIEVPPRFHHPDRIIVHPRDGDGEGAPVEVVAPATGRGYGHQFDEVHRCLAAGLTQSPTMPLADTLSVMETLERALHGLGITVAEDPSVM